MPQPQPCPKCGLPVEIRFFLGNWIWQWSAVCPDEFGCDYIGPEADDREGAIVAHNELYWQDNEEGRAA